MIETPDIDAMLDVLDELIKDVETIDATQAVSLMERVDVLRRKAIEAQGYLKTRSIVALDGQPVRVGDKIYVEKSEGKWRPDHQSIANQIIKRCSYTNDGEVVDDPVLAAALAVQMMQDLYVSPASVPKQGVMERLGMKLRDHAAYERTGRGLKVVEVGDEDK